MTDPKIYKLILSLHKKTENGEVRWVKSIDQEYLASFSDYSVGVSQQANRTTGYVDVYLTIYDDQGEEIETAVDTEFAEDPATVDAAEMLIDLYKSARRMALGVDTALDKLLLELGV